jgi:hypothetical protein
MSERSTSLRRGARTLTAGLLSAALAVYAAGCTRGDSDPATGKSPAASASPTGRPAETGPDADRRTAQLFRDTTLAVGRSVLCMLAHSRSGGGAEGPDFYTNARALFGPDGIDGTPDDLSVALEARNVQVPELFVDAYVRGQTDPELRVSAFVDMPKLLRPLTPAGAQPVLADPATKALTAGYINGATSTFLQISSRSGSLMATGSGMPESPATAADVTAWSHDMLAYTGLIANAGGMSGCAPDQSGQVSPGPSLSVAPSSPSLLPPDVRV